MVDIRKMKKASMVEWLARHDVDRDEAAAMSRSAAMARIRDIDTREYQAGVEGAGRYARSWGGGSLGPSAAAMDALGRTIWASQLAMLTRAEGDGGESSDEDDMLAALQDGFDAEETARRAHA